MSDPFSLLTLALAAGNGTLAGFESQQLIAAGYALLGRSAALVRALDGKRAAILLPPGAPFFVGLGAAEGRGAVLINPLASASEIRWQLADANVGAVFTNTALAERLPSDTTIAVLDDAPRTAQLRHDNVVRTVDLGSHFGLALEGDPNVDGRDEEAVVVYTSAMAGKPLGAILTHKNLLSNVRAVSDALGDGGHDHALAALPFAHLFGLIVAASAPILHGAQVTVMERFHPVRALEAIEQERFTRFMGVPSMFTAMLSVIDRRGPFTNHALRLCFTGGAPVPEVLQDRWYDATGVELRQGYGLTEAAPACLLSRIDQPNRRGTMGVAVSGTDVSIRDVASDAELPRGEQGEICVRGPHVFRGYVSGGADGLQIKNGWLHTGDLGVMHSDNSVSFRGLIKAMFTRNGFNIYPREIEAAFLRMPGVQSAKAWGVPDALKENDITVRIEGDVSEADAKRWAQQELAAYKVPGYFEVTRRL